MAQMPPLTVKLEVDTSDFDKQMSQAALAMSASLLHASSTWRGSGATWEYDKTDDGWCCEYCGSTNADSARFCGDGDVRHCGAPRPVELPEEDRLFVPADWLADKQLYVDDTYRSTGDNHWPPGSYGSKLQILQDSVEETKVELGKVLLAPLSALVKFAYDMVTI